MKKLLVLLFLLPSLMYGQRSAKVWWFDTGIKIQTGFTGLYNTAVVDDAAWNYDIGKGTSYGAKLGANYDKHGITLDVMLGSATQDFENTTDNKAAEVKWKHTDFYLLYRNNQRLGYFELGPKMSLIRSVENSLLEAPDVSDQYASNALSAVLGFGVYFLGSDGAMSGILGLRFEYGIQDLVNDAGQAANAPINDSTFAYTADGYAASHPIFAGIAFELNFGIGYFGRASCGSRSKFIRF